MQAKGENVVGIAREWRIHMFDRNGKDNSSYNVENYTFIKEHSPRVGKLINEEYERQQHNI